MNAQTSTSYGPTFLLRPTAPDASAVPPAFWRLIEIADAAGLMASADEPGTDQSRDTVVRMKTSVSRMLAELRYSPEEFYLLVTLFHAAPHPVSLETLAQETLAESESLGIALERLHAEQVIVAACEEDLEAPVILTPSGKSLLLLLMYRAFRVAFPGPGPHSGRAGAASENRLFTHSL